MAQNNHIIGRMSNMPDVQKTYNWTVLIPKPTGVTTAPEWDGDLELRARSAALPGITINAIESQFLGMKQFFSGNAELEHTLAIEFEEFEDQKVFRYMNAWAAAIFDTQNIAQGGGAAVNVESKADYAVQLELFLYKNNTDKLDRKIVFHNCWIQNIGSAALTYGDSSAVRIPCTFQYDYYTLERS